MEVNIWAVLAAAVVKMILGFAWYSKSVLGKPWVRLIGKTSEQVQDEMKTRNMAALFFAQFLATLISAFVLANFILFTGASSLGEGALVGLWVAVGFVLATSLGNYIFENKSLKLYWINNGYILVSMIITGGLLAIWR